MSGIEMKETKQSSILQPLAIPNNNLPTESFSSNTFISSALTTSEPSTQEEKQFSRLARDKAEPLETTPLPKHPIDPASTISDQPSLREILRPGYEVRAKINILGSIDHELPIHEMHFTLDTYNEEQEKARLTRHSSSPETKEDKPIAYDFDKKDDKQSTGARSSLLQQQRGEEIAHQSVAVSEIFTPSEQLVEKVETSRAKGDDKSISSLSPVPIHRVLIIGPPGSGKTTLSKFLAQQWSTGKLWQERYHQVFWLTLRDVGNPVKSEQLAKCYASAFPLAALIHQFGLNEVAQQQIGIKQIHQLLTTQPQKTLLILDGYDEIAQKLSNSSDTPHPLKSLLAAAMTAPCDLIVTSREYSLPPHKIQVGDKPVELRFDRQLVNQGFTDEQTRSYIQQHFRSSSKSDAKIADEVQSLIQGNYRLWTYVHNPLILSLTCNFYRNAYKHGKTQLAMLGLVELYEDTLCIFIRRYLDMQGKVLGKPELAWDNTKNWSKNTLLNTCSVEMDFLQTLAFLGVERSVQQFGKELQEQASALVEKHNLHAQKGYFTLALCLGFLHEFPSSDESPLHRSHEFTHLTFQEYLAARYLAERLQNNDPAAYRWLRTYKYHASYRQVFDFLCGLMPPTAEIFWQVLLEEQTDLTGFGQLSLRLYSLEAGHFHPDIPGLRRYVDEVGQLLIHYVKTKKLTEATTLPSVLKRCPGFFSQLGGKFWDALKLLFREKEEKPSQQIWELVWLITSRSGHLNSSQCQWLMVELLQATRSNNSNVQQVAVENLERVAAHVVRFTPDDRVQLLTTLCDTAKDNNSNAQQAAIKALGCVAYKAGQLTAEERTKLQGVLLKLMEDENLQTKTVAVEALKSYTYRIKEFNSGEATGLVGRLLQTLKKKNEDVITILQSVVYKARQLTAEERTELRDILLKATEDENSSVQEAAIQALERVTDQVEQFATDERTSWLQFLVEKTTDREKLSMRRVAFRVLGRFASQAGQFTPEERTKLWDTFFKAAEDPDPEMHSAVVWALEHYTDQIAQFTPGERAPLLKTLLSITEKPNPDEQQQTVAREDVRKAIAKALEHYIRQARLFISGEAIGLVKKLWPAIEKENDRAMEAFGSFISVIGQYTFTSSERTELLNTLLEATKHEKQDIRAGAFFALLMFIPHLQFTPGEYIDLRNRLLKATKNIKSDEERAGIEVFVQPVAFLILGYSVSQAEWFTPTERREMLNTLLAAAKNNNSEVQQRAAIAALKNAALRRGFTSGERTELLNTLLEAAKSGNSEVQREVFEILQDFANQVKRFSTSERTELLNTLLEAAKSGNSNMQREGFLTFQRLADQAEQFTSDERTQLLRFLLHTAKNDDPSTRSEAINALGHVAGQGGQFTRSERTELLNTLLEAAKDNDRNVRQAAMGALGSYIQQARQFIPDERSKLSSALVKTAGSRDLNLQKAAMWVLKFYAEYTGQFTSDERAQLLVDLFQLAKKAPITVKGPDEGYFTYASRPEVIKIINAIPFTRDDLVSGPLFKSYFAYKEELGKPFFVEGELLLPATPLTELLYAYVYDSAELPAELAVFIYATDTAATAAYEKGFFEPRRNLWLKIILARIAKGEAVITVSHDEYKLHSSQLAKPVLIPFPKERPQELAKALANQAKQLGLPVYMAVQPLVLPAQIHTPLSVYDGRNKLTTEQLNELILAQNQTKQEVNDVKVQVGSQRQRLDDHERRLQNTESDVEQLKSQTQAHAAAFKAQEMAITDLRKEMKVIGKDLENSIIASKDAIQKNEEELREQGEELSKLTEQLAQRKKEAKEQGKTIESLGEGYHSLQQQQRELQEKFDKSEATLLKKYEGLAEKLKARLDVVEKTESKQDKICKDLQEKQQVLEDSLKKMRAEIEALQSADAYTLEELQKLQKLQARQEEMVKTFEATQKQLQERQSLFSEPKFSQFYRTMHLKLSGFFLVCSVVATGLIKAESQAGLSEKIVTKVIGALGDNLPVPGAKAAASFINSMIEWHRKHQEEQGRDQTLDSAPISFSDKETAIDLATQEVIHRYGQHIKVLTEGGVTDLAECSVNRIAHGIQDEKLSKQQSSDNFPLYLVQFLHQLHPKQGTAGFINKKIATLKGVLPDDKTWNEDGIFRRTGIQSPACYYYSDKIESHWIGKDKPICNYKKYGFRQIADDKLAKTLADQQQLEETNVALPAGSFQFKSLAAPQQQAPQGTSTFFNKAKRAAIGVAEDQLPGAVVQWAADHQQQIKDQVQSAANQVGDTLASSITTIGIG